MSSGPNSKYYILQSDVSAAMFMKCQVIHYRTQTKCLTNYIFNRLNISSKKFWSGHRVFANTPYTSFVNNVQSTLFANIVCLGLYPAVIFFLLRYEFGLTKSVC